MPLNINPKLALIPSGYKASKVYSVLPTDGTGDFDFSRSVNATRVNSEGLIETVSTNVPRLNYPLIDGVVSGCPSLLLEPSRTNLITYSEALSNWSNINNVTITDNSTISPDGSLNSSKINETADNNVHRLFTNPTVSSAKHTYSVFLKAGTRKWAYLRLDGATTEQRTWFDLENGVIGTINSDHNASIENFGNGWYRCSVSIKGTTYDTTPLAILAIATGNNIISYTGDVNEYIYAWGAQLEAGSYPTSYIPTSGTTATRSTENFTKTGLSNYINSQEGILYLEMAALVNSETGSNRAITINGIGGSVTDLITIRFEPALNTIIAIRAKTGDTTLSISRVISDVTSFNKIAFSWKQNEFNLWNNGIKIGSLTSGNTFSAGLLDAINSNIGNGTQRYSGEIKDLRVYSTVVNDSDLETLTSWDSFSDMAIGQLYTIE